MSFMDVSRELFVVETINVASSRVNPKVGPKTCELMHDQVATANLASQHSRLQIVCVSLRYWARSVSSVVKKTASENNRVESRTRWPFNSEERLSVQAVIERPGWGGRADPHGAVGGRSFSVHLHDWSFDLLETLFLDFDEVSMIAISFRRKPLSVNLFVRSVLIHRE